MELYLIGRDLCHSIAFLLSDKSLESQNVKNNGQIMVLLLSQSIAESELQQKKEKETKASVSRTRQAAEALSSRKDSEWLSFVVFIKLHFDWASYFMKWLCFVVEFLSLWNTSFLTETRYIMIVQKRSGSHRIQ